MIADWSELMVEVSQRIKDGSVMQRAAMLTGLAEDELNRDIRTAEMEAQATLVTDADGVAALPADFLDARAVTLNGKRLTAYPLAQLRNRTQRGYAIIGSTFASTETEADVVLDYYQRIPDLKTNGTNWLLQSDPQIYLYAVMKQAMLAVMNLEGAAGAASYMADLIERKRNDDAHRRFGDTMFQFSGVAP